MNRWQGRNILTVLAMVVILAIAFEARAEESSSVYTTVVPPREGEKYTSARFSLWLPEAEIVRAIIVHQHGCGRNGIETPQDLQWRALAKKWDAALMGSHYTTGEGPCQDWCDPTNGSERAFLAAIETFSREGNHPELVHAPWVLWGHSGGAAWVYGMTMRHPERVVAAFPRSLAWIVGEELDGLRRNSVPIMLSVGAKEKTDRFARIYTLNIEGFPRLRESGILASLAIDPRSSHDCRHSRALAIPFFDTCLGQRLPEPSADSATLRPMVESQAWLGNLETHEIAPVSDYDGPAARAAWLPDDSMARKWQEFVQTGEVRDKTPPNHAPTDLRACSVQSDAVTLGWSADADLESGIREFIIYRNGRRVGTCGGSKDDGRPVRFQDSNYGDEPRPVRPEMRFTDRRLFSATRYRYEVSTVNGAGLESTRSQPLDVRTTE